MSRAMLKTASAYFFGEGRILARTHKLNITAFFLFHPNSSLKFETVCEEIKNSSMSENDKTELLGKFAALKNEWREVAIETLISIDKTLNESDESTTDSQTALVSETTKLVIAGRTYASEVATSKPLGIDDEITRYEKFSFAEFIKC